MTKSEFLFQLNKELVNVSNIEANNILQYYGEYFDESPLSEEETAQELGSPQTLAKQIIAESRINSINEMPASPKKGFSAVMVALLAIFASPIALPILIAIAAVVFAFLIAVFAVVFSFFITGIALVAAGILGVIFFFVFAFIHLPASIGVLGFSFVSLGAGVLIIIGMVYLNRIIINGVVRFAKWVSRKGRKNEAIY